MSYEQALEAAKAYADERLAESRAKIDALRHEIDALRDELSKANAAVISPEQAACTIVDRQLKIIRDDVIETLLDRGLSYETIGAALPKIDDALEDARVALMPGAMARVILDRDQG